MKKTSSNLGFSYARKLSLRVLLLTSLCFSFYAPDYAVAGSISSGNSQQQSKRIIKGVVKDSDGNPLPGATIQIKGEAAGTVSDGNGKFELSVPDNSSLVVSFIGYNSTTIKVPQNSNEVNVVLSSSNVGLDEVVVTGVAAGTPKEKLGFSIEKISVDKLNKVPATDVASALTGKVAGVKVTKSNGAPGSESEVQLRGAKTIYGSSNPLYIIDGVLTESGMVDISPEDIASIEVLKGAAASSLYGSRAANGVVSIITKRGSSMRAGTVQVDYRTESGADFLGYVPKQTTATDAVIQNGKVNYAITEPDLVYNNKYPSLSNPLKQFFRPGAYLTNHLALRGTSKDGLISVYSAAEVTKESGVVKMVDGMLRTNFRLNVDYKISDKLKFTTSNLYTNTSTDDRANGVFGQLFRSDPDVDLLAPNIDGTPYQVNANKISDGNVNPLYSIHNSINKTQQSKLISFLGFEYRPTDELTFTASYGTTRTDGDNFYLSPKGIFNYDLTLTTGYISRSMWKNIEETGTVDGMFSKKLGDFNTKLKLQYLYESSSSKYMSGGGGNLGISGMDVTSLNLSGSQSISSSIQQTVANNVAFLATTDYMGKYIFDGLVRRDASSLFGANVRWQTFYRLSGAWRITQDFQIPGIDEWKVRASYGVAGLRPPFEAQYETFSLVNGVPGNMETLGNKNLKPSFSKETEVGTDLSFLKRFTFSTSYSITNNTDQILKVPISPLSGAMYQWQNAGTIQNKVLEATFTADAVKGSDWNVNLALTFDKVKQKITKLDCPPYMLNGGMFRIQQGIDFGVMYLDRFARSLDEVKNQVPAGRTVNEVFAINNQGFVVLRSQIGTINEVPVKVKDDNGNILALPTKSMTPNFNINLTPTISYKAFTFYMLWSYQNGGAVYDHAVRYTTEPRLFDQSGKPWNEVKANPYYANSGQTGGILGWNNNVLLFDATFLKLREISASYDFKIKDQTAFIKNLRVSVLARNLLTLTKYPGFDPEGVSGSVAASAGTDANVMRLDSNDSYPIYRTFSGSVSLTF